MVSSSGKEDGNPTKKELLQAGKETESSKDLSTDPIDNGAFTDLPAGSSLQALMKLTPLSDYLDRRAYAMYRHSTLQGRVNKYCEVHPRVARLCTALDLSIRIIVVIILLCLIAASGFKALWPLL